MNYISKKGLIELVKSFGRFIYFGIIGLVSTFLLSLMTDENLLNVVWTLGEVSIPAGVWIVSGIGFIVKALDRYKHSSDNSESHGIAPKFLQK